MDPKADDQINKLQVSDFPFSLNRSCVFFRLLQIRMEKEESEEEVKELQEKVSSMKRQMPDPSQAQTLNQVQETPPQHCWAVA